MNAFRTKKVRIAFEQGDDPMFIGSVNSETGKVVTMHLFTLLSFKVEDGTIQWSVRDDRGRHTTSGKNMTQLEGTSVFIKPSIPMVIHERQASAQLLAPEFIFVIPSDLQVYPLSVIKKRCPQTKTSPYRLG